MNFNTNLAVTVCVWVLDDFYDLILDGYNWLSCATTTQILQ